MASRLVTWEEWLAHGHYPDGSKPGEKFNPKDPNLRAYYDNYVSVWTAAPEALRIAINIQHGLAFANSDGDDDDDDRDKPETHPPTGPVFTPLDPAGIAQRDYSAYYPQSYMPSDPAYPTMGLLSQPAFGGTDLYQPWSAQYGDNVAPESLWDYQPPSGLDVKAGPKVGFV